MFTSLAQAAFSFLANEFGFRAVPINGRSVQFERDDIFVRVFHTGLDEVAMRMGRLSLGFDKGFSGGVLLALSSPDKGFALRDKIASHPEEISNALTEQAALLKIHGERILRGDKTVFDEMQQELEEYWADRNAVQTRARAETEFAAKNYSAALKHYRSLGSRAKPLDVKRIEFCQRNLQ